MTHEHPSTCNPRMPLNTYQSLECHGVRQGELTQHRDLRSRQSATGHASQCQRVGCLAYMCNVMHLPHNSAGKAACDVPPRR